MSGRPIFTASAGFPIRIPRWSGRHKRPRRSAASRQLERAVRFICERHGVGRVSIIAHSWGTIVTGLFAGRCPELVDRLVFFGPIARREPVGERIRLDGWRLISLEDQWNRFTETVPPGEPAVLLRRHFEEWASAISIQTRRAEPVRRRR